MDIYCVSALLSPFRFLLSLVLELYSRAKFSGVNDSFASSTFQTNFMLGVNCISILLCSLLRCVVAVLTPRGCVLIFLIGWLNNLCIDYVFSLVSSLS